MAATEADLTAAIVADPDDRDARLIYADWLARAGDPRGELMHLELAREHMLEGDDNYDVIVARIAALVAEHHTLLLSPLWRLQIPDVRYGLHLGLPASVSGTPEAIAAASVRLSAKAPLVTRLEVAMQSSLRALVRTSVLERATALAIAVATLPAKCLSVLGEERTELRELSLRGAIQPQSLEWLVDAELPRLSRLVLSGCRYGSDRMQRLRPREAEWAALEALVRIQSPLSHFELVTSAWGGGQSLGPPLGKIVGGMTCPLRVLALHGNQLERTGIEALRPALGSVEQLDLGYNALPYDGLRDLLAAVPRVRVLKLPGNALGDHGAELIAGWSGASTLHTLDLGNTSLTSRGVRALATSSQLANLRLLRLDGPNDGDSRRALARSKHLLLAKIEYCGASLDRSPTKSKRHRGA